MEPWCLNAPRLFDYFIWSKHSSPPLLCHSLVNFTERYRTLPLGTSGPLTYGGPTCIVDLQLCAPWSLIPPSSLYSLVLLVLLSIFMQCFVWLLTLGLAATASLCVRNFCFSCYINLSESDTQEMMWLSLSPLPIGNTGKEGEAGEKFSLDAENNLVWKSNTAIWGVFIFLKFIKDCQHVVG